MDVVVARRRPPRLLRAHGEGQGRSSSQNVADAARSSERIALKTVDEPESPALLARRQARSRSPALRDAMGDIFTVNLETQRGHQPHAATSSPTTRRPSRPTASPSSTWRGSAATRSCSGSISTRRRRRSSPSARTTTRRRSSSTTTRSCSRRRRSTRRSRSSPRWRKNGNIYNIWTLNLKTGELKQYTDALGGNVSPGRAARTARASRIAFVTLLQGRLRPAHARAQGAAHRRRPPPTSARRARSSTSRRRCSHTLVAAEQAEEGHVREDVPRGPAAGQRRRHEQRRRLRRHGDHRSATCSATSSSTCLRRVDLAVPDARRLAT